MEEIHSFFVKTGINRLVPILERISGTTAKINHNSATIIEEFPSNAETVPDILLVATNKDGWCRVEHNSLQPLHDWGSLLSKELNTMFVQIMFMFQEYITFLVFEKGEIIREIEVLDSLTQPFKDLGQRFPFEDDPVYDESIGNWFSVDTAWHYCEELGIDLQYYGGAYILQKK